MIQEVISRGSTQGNAEVALNVSTTLTTKGDRTIIAHKAVVYDARNSRIGGKISGTLQAKESGGYSLNHINPLIETEPDYIVRRLMPIECGRLQGFPDGWGEIETLQENMPDEAADFWREVYRTDCEIKEKRPQRAILENKGKLAAWHNKLHTDSAEYKMWGNGMALPNALFFIQRAVKMAAERYGRDSTRVSLGSMFDGSGTMPLCAAMCGARPVWASEVEPYPIAVTRTHLPGMKHVGSVLNLDGAKLEPVDIITFGSPCQDLSTAGKRAGLDGNRSGLFRVAVKIIHEMLTATDGKYPRFVIWENVLGATSSNEGKDFEVVLNELRKLTGADEPIRQHGKWGGYAGYGAVAYRLVNAQYWGVPQRRRRIYACADTCGNAANEILFDRKGDGWHFEPSIPEGKTVAGIAADGYRWHERMVAGAGDGEQKAYTMKIRSGCEGGGKGPLVQENLSATLATHQDQTVFAPQKAMGFAYEAGAKARGIGYGEISPTAKCTPPQWRIE